MNIFNRLFLPLLIGNIVLLVASCGDSRTGDYYSRSYPVVVDDGVVYSTDLLGRGEQDPFVFSGCSLFFGGVAIVKTLDGELGYLSEAGYLFHPRHPENYPLVKLIPFHCGNAVAHFQSSEMYEFWTVDQAVRIGEEFTPGRPGDSILLPCDRDILLGTELPHLEQYKRAFDFSEGLAYVCDDDDVWYFVNRQGDVKIENVHFSAPQPSAIVSFWKGVSWVPMGSGRVPVTRSGEVLSDVVADEVHRCGDGLDFVLIDGKIGLLRGYQEYLFTPRWSLIGRWLNDRESMFYRFNGNGLAWVMEDNLVYTIDMFGKKLPDSEIPFDGEWMH